MTQQPTLPRICVIGDFLVKSGWALEPRVNSEYELLLFPQASKTVFYLNQERYVLDEPCVLLIPPHVTHYFEFISKQPLRHLFIHFVHTPESEADPLRSIPTFIPVNQTVIVEKMFAHILCLADQKPQRWKARACASLNLLLEELASLNIDTANHETPYQSRWIEQTIEYIDSHLNDVISIKELAALVGWTHEYFTRTFTAIMSFPPQQYILQRRIERACELLVTEHWSIKEIAYSTGFQSEPYFCRAFHKIKGVTASQYREISNDPKVKNLYLAVKHDKHLSYRQNTYYFA
jgi:AraC family transcriptional regulator